MATRLGVVGFGTMGCEIALLGALAGLEVTAYDAFPQVFETNLKRLGKITRMLSRDAKFFATDAIADDVGRQAVLSRISTTSELGDLVDCQFIIEAAPERVELKRELLSSLGTICAPDVLLATNTSSISITELASFTESNPERVVGMHFFNPPTLMKLVEIIPGLVSSPAMVEAAVNLADELGRTPVCIKETPGFVVNRVLLAMMVEAIVLYETGIASIEDIDTAMKLGAGMPLGPFKLADLVGLDTIHHALEILYSELGDSKFKPPFVLIQHVRAGRLGRKARHGFYKY